MRFFAPATNTPSVTSSELDAMRAELKAMRQELAAMRTEQVADTTGAGDSFIGSFCFGVATGMALPAAMRLGAYVAARKCTALGARPGLPRRDTVPEELFI